MTSSRSAIRTRPSLGSALVQTGKIKLILMLVIGFILGIVASLGWSKKKQEKT